MVLSRGWRDDKFVFLPTDVTNHTLCFSDRWSIWPISAPDGTSIKGKLIVLLSMISLLMVNYNREFGVSVRVVSVNLDTEHAREFVRRVANFKGYVLCYTRRTIISIYVTRKVKGVQFLITKQFYFYLTNKNMMFNRKYWIK